MKTLPRSLLATVPLLLWACSSAAPPAPGPSALVELTIAIPPPPSALPSAPPAPPAREELPPASLIEWKVGAYLSLSGEEGQFGVDTKEGIDLAVDEVNAGGGPRGKPIRVLYADDEGNSREAVNKVLELIDQGKVVALLGEVASSRSRAGGIVANKKQIPMISPAATHPAVTQIGPFVFRSCFIDSVQGKAAARYLVRTMGKKKLALLFGADDLYSAALASAFRDEVARLGAKLVIEQSFPRAETNFTPYLKAIRAQRPDNVYAPMYYTSMVPIARQAKAVGLSGDMFMGCDGWNAETLLRDAAAKMEGATFTDHWVMNLPRPSSRAFVAAYQQRYRHDPSVLAAMGYEAAGILADAITRAKGNTPDAIREAIQATRDFPGLSGKISIDADRNGDRDVVIVRIEKGRFTYHASVQ